MQQFPTFEANQVALLMAEKGQGMCMKLNARDDRFEFVLYDHERRVISL